MGVKVVDVALKSVIAFGCGVALAMSLLAFLSKRDSPNDALTKARMREAKREVCRYYAEHGELPESLEEIMAKRGDNGFGKSAGGWPFLYSASNGTIVTLRTQGRFASKDEPRRGFTCQFDVREGGAGK